MSSINNVIFTKVIERVSQYKVYEYKTFIYISPGHPLVADSIPANNIEQRFFIQLDNTCLYEMYEK